MIRAYNDGLFESATTGITLVDFVDQTTLTVSPVETEAALLQFISEEQASEETRDGLNAILCDPFLLSKTLVVSDRNWRNCVLVASPLGLRVTQGAVALADGTVDLTATLTYWRQHAESIFVVLSPTEISDSDRTLNESTEWLSHWLFKRYFGPTGCGK